ncbi:MAG: cytochrome b/b6 domain-containing protein [Nocardioidaceae bacterium]|nr:cytochrome b/b6 domain-containing protein [Nocardioidaceae bacterium]
MAPATEPVVQRYRRWVRWLHAGVYTSTLVLLVTGLWLLAGKEGRPSFLSRLTGLPDTTLHTRVGWVLTALLGGGILLGGRGAVRFVLSSVRFRRGDLVWFRRWPAALVTGRFPRHEGEFDPGQRIANLVMVLAFAAVVGSGVAMARLHGGPAFVWLVPVHRWSTYVLLPLLAGHVLIAAGVLPGYRGVWRSMHLGGRLRVSVARRLWPAWTEQVTGARPRGSRDATPSGGSGSPGRARRGG